LAEIHFHEGMMDTHTNGTNTGESQVVDERSEREKRREERRAARGERSGSAWIIGVILIAVGLIWMFPRLQIFSFTNWWALFILIPAVAAFGNAWRAYKNAGNHLDAQARGSLFGGLLLTCVAAAFLLNLNWTIVGPVLIILLGVGLLINALAR
jgi:cation transport ATPase